MKFETLKGMKTKVLIMMLLCAALGNVSAQEINWVSLEEALALQKKEPKKILMDVYTNWCGPCKMLDKNTFHNKDVVEYVNKHYYAVKFNAEGNDVVKYQGATYSNPGYKPEMASRRNSVHQLTSFLRVRAYPTLVFMDEKGQENWPIVGYKNPQQLELYLKMFKENKHKDMKTQEDFNAYYNGFKYEFTN